MFYYSFTHYSKVLKAARFDCCYSLAKYCCFYACINLSSCTILACTYNNNVLSCFSFTKLFCMGLGSERCNSIGIHFLLFFMRSVFIHCANGCSSVEHRFCNLLLLNVECYWYLVLQYCDERIKKCNELRNRHIKPIRFNRIRLICPYNSNYNFFYTMNRIIVFRDFSSCYEEFEKQSLFDICVDWCRPCNMHRHTIRSIGFVHSLLFLRLL